MTTHEASGAINRSSINDAPFNLITITATLAVFGGIFLDGYILGVIGYALVPASAELQLSLLGEGLIAATALVGIFIGGSVFGGVSDRFGRKKVFFWSLIGFAVVSLLQLFVVGTWDLVFYRLLLGILIGVEYAVGTSYLAEFTPKAKRSVLLGSISVFWFVGFVAALVAGSYWPPDAWRWLLASSVIPAIITLVIRFRLPESPRWLHSQGRDEEALAIIKKHWGPEYGLPEATNVDTDVGYRAFFRENDWRIILYSGLFWACQVAPLFTVFTFLPLLLAEMDFSDGLSVELIVNGLQLVGAVLGIWLLWAMSRRGLVIWTFLLSALFLLTLGLWRDMPAPLELVIFGLFTVIFVASTNIQYVYPPEMFETRFRSTGVGLAAAMSRIGAAGAAFLFPASLANLGVGVTLVLIAAFPIVGLVASLLWAPETKDQDIDAHV